MKMINNKLVPLKNNLLITAKTKKMKQKSKKSLKNKLIPLKICLVAFLKEYFI
jgi:hypothetical protein